MQRKILQRDLARLEKEAMQAKRKEEVSLPGQAKRMVSSSASLAKTLAVGVAGIAWNAAAAAADHVLGHNDSSSAMATGSDLSSSAGATAPAVVASQVAAEAESGASVGKTVLIASAVVVAAAAAATCIFWNSKPCLRARRAGEGYLPVRSAVDKPLDEHDAELATGRTHRSPSPTRVGRGSRSSSPL